MFRTAFSTVAAPQWTLERVARAADEYGYDGVELRTFGSGGAKIACDPALSDPAKARALFADAGVLVAGIGSGVSFDEPIVPPVIGRVIGDYEKSVRAAKRDADLCRRVGGSIVRVFGFGVPYGESHKSATRRIIDRLRLVVDDARNTGVRIALENGGDFATAAQAVEIVSTIDSPLLGVCYNLAVGVGAGDDPAAALEAIGANLFMARVKDVRDGAPAQLGDGELPVCDFIKALAHCSFGGWVTFEWDKLWRPEIAEADDVLGAAAMRLYEWAGIEQGSRETVAA